MRGAHCLSAMNASVVIKSSMRLVGTGHVILRHRRGVAGVLRLLAGIFRSSRAARIEGRAWRTRGITRRGARGLTRLVGLARHVGRGVRVIVSAPVAGRARGRRSACLRMSRCRRAAWRGSCGEPRRKRNCSNRGKYRYDGSHGGNPLLLWSTPSTLVPPSIRLVHRIGRIHSMRPTAPVGDCSSAGLRARRLGLVVVSALGRKRTVG